MLKEGRIIASAAGETVAVAGASAGALSAATVIVAVGAAVALGFAGYGVYCWLSQEKSAPRLMMATNCHICRRPSRP